MMKKQEVEISTVLGTGIRIGLIGGVIAVLIALEGMLQAFQTRDIIGGVISMGQILLLITVLASAYVAVSRSGSPDAILSILTGALSGLVTSILVVALIALGNVVNLGDMFISATAQLYELLTLKQGLANGSLALVILGVGLGAVSAIIYLLPSSARRAIVMALVGVVAFGLLQDLISVTLSNWEAITPLTKFLYASNGLSIEGAATLFVLIAAITYLRTTQGTRIQSGIKNLPPASRQALRWGSILLVIIILLSLPLILGLYLSEVLDNVGLFLLMGLGLNIVVGFAGLLDLGYVAFFAIGAYTVGVLTSPELGHIPIVGSWWVALPFAVIVALFAGIVLGIPVLKMRGDYLAIVTLGFGEIIRLLAQSDLLKAFLGGAQGTRLIAKPDIGSIQVVSPQQFYYIIIVGCLLAAFVATRVKSSRLGRAWMAVREDEDVAQAMGINLVVTKLMAFALGASFGGLSGAIFASKLGSIFPSSFNFLVSVNVLSLIIIGGMGSIPGVIVGALALVGLPELLREVGDYRYLFYGAALVLMMLTRPEGLIPEARRRMELEEFKEEGEAMPVGASAE